MNKDKLIYELSDDYQYLYDGMLNGKTYIGVIEHQIGYLKPISLQYNFDGKYFDIGFIVFRDDIDAGKISLAGLCQKYNIKFFKP